MKTKLFFFTVLILIQINTFAQSEKIVVNDLEGFLNAIKSNVIIEITRDLYFDQELSNYVGAGDYYEIDTIDNEFLFRVNNIREYGIIIKNVDNLTIIGKTTQHTKLISDYKSRDVLTFIKCTNITISNIEAGHKLETECDGDVFVFNNSSDISLIDCKLFGSGAIGLELYNVKYISCNNIEIYDCSLHIMSITNTKDLTFTNCKFYDNKKIRSLFEFSNSSIINFNNCTIENNSVHETWNKGNGYLFQVNENCHNIKLKNCIIKDNIVNHISIQKDNIELINSPLTNNKIKIEKYCPPSKNDYLDDI